MSPESRVRSLVDESELTALCRRWKIRELAVFGSALRDDFEPASDIDLLVDFEPGVVLGFRYFELERELSRLFGGRRVDLVRRKYLHPLLRERILAEAEVQFAA
jgi:hypothetical protein